MRSLSEKFSIDSWFDTSDIPCMTEQPSQDPLEQFRRFLFLVEAYAWTNQARQALSVHQMALCLRAHNQAIGDYKHGVHTPRRNFK